jgi:hypothetical protein
MLTLNLLFDPFCRQGLPDHLVLVLYSPSDGLSQTLPKVLMLQA